MASSVQEPPPAMRSREPSMDEELECRVCRSPAEEGRPLFSPCRCSGSIQFCHQECLVQWLEHSHKDKCELCDHKFNFHPLYAPDAPEQLPLGKVLRSCARRAATEWIPFVARILLAAVLWLLVVPLSTSWLYRIWIHRSRVFAARLTMACLWSDVISGLIIAAAIILSFLSLMSFADFLRFHWDVDGIERPQPVPFQEPEPAPAPFQVPAQPPPPLPNNNAALNRGALPPPRPPLLPNVAAAAARPGDGGGAAAAGPPGAADEHNPPVNAPPAASAGGALHEAAHAEDYNSPNEDEWGFGDVGDDDDDEAVDDEIAEEAAAAAAAPVQEMGDGEEGEDSDDDEDDEDAFDRQEGGHFDFADLQGGMDDGLNDVELHVAVDELLGVRGPIAVLVRNLLWLLAFNGAYLGLFAFVPFSIGSSLVAAAARYMYVGDFGDGDSSQSGSFEAEAATSGSEGSTAEAIAAAAATEASLEASNASLLAPAADGNVTTSEASAFSSSSSSASVWVLLRELAATGRAEDHTLQLPDLATMALGYLAISVMVFAWRALLRAIVADRPGGNLDRVDVGLRGMGFRGAGGGGAVGGAHGGIPAPVDGMRGIAGGLGGGGNFSPLMRRLRLVLEGTAAVVKVGMLLFLKMLLLPLLLGVCLDTATFTLFAASGASRMQFTAQNLVASLLLHWVLGITFMLFVTVSVLQLREVLHPDLFASMIRPQEPHPDLLGSLLQESGPTHARRMAMSLAIYLALLAAFVYVPTALVEATFSNALPVQLRLCYVVPQLQVPVELVVFHLSVLAFLERFKNRLGELQHVWLVASTRVLGLSRFLLPMPKLQPAAAADDDDGDDAGINATAVAADAPRAGGGEAAAAAVAGASAAADGLSSDGNNGDSVGDRVGDRTGFGIRDAINDDDEDDDHLVGPPMPRPPPGWDDLMGGAQGRWAWGDEPKSPLELSVAARKRPKHCTLRLVALFAASWLAVLLLAMSGALLPLWLGRGLLLLLHVPASLGHDPLAFGGGAALLVAAAPTLKTWADKLASGQVTAAVLHGMRRTRRRNAGGEGDRGRSDFGGPNDDRVGLGGAPGVPLRVWRVLLAFGGLWFLTTPLLVGLFFEAAVVTSAKDWADAGLRSLHPVHDWALGLLLVHLWAAVAAAGYLGDPNKDQAANPAGAAAAAGGDAAGAAAEDRGGANPAVDFVALAAGAAAPLGYGPLFVAPPVGVGGGELAVAAAGGVGAGGAFGAAVAGGGSWEARVRAARAALEAVSEERWEDVSWDVLVQGLALPALLGVLQLTVPPAAAALLGASLMNRSVDGSDGGGNGSSSSSSDGSSLAGDESSSNASSAAVVGLSAAASATTTGSLLSLFRRALATSLVFSLAARLAAPAAAMAKALHDQLRDDEYLVGLELQDFQGRPETPAAEAAAAGAAGAGAIPGAAGVSASSSTSSSSAPRGAAVTSPVEVGPGAAAAGVVAEAALAAASEASAAAAGTGVC